MGADLLGAKFNEINIDDGGVLFATTLFLTRSRPASRTRKLSVPMRDRLWHFSVTVVKLPLKINTHLL